MSETDAQPKWNRVVRIANETGDLNQLVQLLREDVPLPANARLLLADLLDRHNIKKKPGGQKLPINRRSLTEVKMASAVRAVRELKSRGMSEDEALEIVANAWKLVTSNLKNALDGKRGASNRFGRA